MKYPKTVIFFKEFQPEMVVSSTNDRKNSKQLHISQYNIIGIQKGDVTVPMGGYL